MHGTPRVSVGMPVHNGEAYLAGAIESLLTQTFEDFELIISDNASTDGTEEICRHFAETDTRVRYYRNPTNLGAALNYNRLFTLSRAPYFKWAPHDDLYAPTYLQRCVEVLDETPSHVVLCYPKTVLIDENGDILREYADNLDIRHPMPSDRLRCLLLNAGSWCHAVLGLIRSRALQATRLIGNTGGSDNVLLAELVMQGEFLEIPEPLFFRRVHRGSSLHANESAEQIATWFDPHNKDRVVLPRSRLLLGHLQAIYQSSLTWRERIACYYVVHQARFAKNWPWRVLRRETTRAIKRITWDRWSAAAVKRSTSHYIPHRIWAFLSGLRRVDPIRLRLGLSRPSPDTHAALLDFVADCLSMRADSRAEQVLAEWLEGPCEIRRAAAAGALARYRNRCEQRLAETLWRCRTSPTRSAGKESFAQVGV